MDYLIKIDPATGLFMQIPIEEIDEETPLQEDKVSVQLETIIEPRRKGRRRK